MTKRPRRAPLRQGACAMLLVALAVIDVAAPAGAVAQDRLRSMPGYARWQGMASQIAGSVQSGALNVTWSADGSSFDYVDGGRPLRYEIATGRSAAPDDAPAATPFMHARLGPGRGRQYDSAFSPDSSLRAFHRDRNLWLVSRHDGEERPITTAGSEADRTKYGTASWVYGEELDQNTAIWWSPDSRRVAFYFFDESRVPDYYLQLNQSELQSTVEVEAYPKAGVDNPLVEIHVYDVATGTTTKLDIRDGQPFADDVVGHYAYNVQWTPDGSEVLLYRMNRRQNVLELAACNPEDGRCRVVLREEWPTGWVESSPPMHFLEDGRRCLWISERSGFRNILLYDLAGRQHAALTRHPFEVGEIVRIDEAANVVWYTARSGENYLRMQLHRVGLDGRGERRLTDPAFHHTVSIAPDGRHFIDVAQTHAVPPFTRLLDETGRVVAELAKSDMNRFERLGLQRVEMFGFRAADGSGELLGLLHKPSGFDPSKRYPVLVSVYAGPGTNGARETFSPPNALTEFGFLVVTLDGRNSGGRGKRALDALYGRLGVVEVDDIAAGVKALAKRPYVDANRVGIYGTSYGGYAAIMALLRHPQLFHAAAASSPVTDWRHYDTIYTERFMGLPQENRRGYDAGSAMTYVNNLRGRLMIYYGTADNNVHPNNAMQLIAELQRAGRSFDVMVGPDRGHTAMNLDRMMEFFIDELVVRPMYRPAAAQ
jgi:dipeptidyl-peptidase 4